MVNDLSNIKIGSLLYQDDNIFYYVLNIKKSSYNIDIVDVMLFSNSYRIYDHVMISYATSWIVYIVGP